MFDAESLYTLSTWAVPMVIAITLHEAAHGFVADKLGDPTARNLGRVSFNPLRHIDPFGSLLLPGLLALSGAPVFGWAKAVPVVARNFRHPRRDMALVAAAGPGINLLMAVLAMAVLSAFVAGAHGGLPWLNRNLINFAVINLFLAALNMLPLPPLDGSKVLVRFLPESLARLFDKFERQGMWFVIAMLVLVPAVFKVDPIGDVLIYCVGAVLKGMALITGLTLTA
jgi:Zn-dependent protease